MEILEPVTALISSP